MRRTGQRLRVRLACARGLFLILFVMIGWRAFQLQVLQGDKLKRLGERQHLKEWIVLPKRGAIMDRSGEPLALSVESSSVYVRPHRVHDAKTTARSLAQIFQMKLSEVQEKIMSDKPFVWLKRQISPDEAEKVQALNTGGVGMFYEPNRYYPQGRLAGQLIGFVGRDSQGLEGLELRYDEFIRGESASSVIQRDALGRRVLVQGVERLQNPPGGDIHLTLDTAIQHLAEKELEVAVTKFRAKAGVAIVVAPFTGEILALANYPFFNPNNFSKHSAYEMRNRAVTDSFEPGSTFKAILAAGALEEGVVGKEDIFYCEQGRYSYGGKVIHDTHPYGWLPFSKILQVSSNIGITKVAEKLRKERYFKYIEKFGFGTSTDLDVPGESQGLMRRPESWSTVDLATHAFGQGISTTPIQMAMAYATIANGGFLMRPFVVRRVVDGGGKVLAENQPRVVRRVISEKTAKSLASMLTDVTREGGTGVMASVEGFKVAGKTGTAQKADPVHGGYAAGKRVASFVGFVPADDPRLVLMVLVDEPQVNVFGGVVAAPVFRNIARGALRHLAVLPSKPDPVPVLGQALEPAMRRQFRRSPDHLDENSVQGVPDFVGLSLREAVEKARSMKLKVKMRGNGYVTKQTPAPGAHWRENSILLLTLQG